MVSYPDPDPPAHTLRSKTAEACKNYRAAKPLKLNRLKSRPGGYVLIVGNDIQFLDYYRRNFLDHEFVPLTVSTYAAALGFLRLFVFDLVLVDEGGSNFTCRCILECTQQLGHPSPIVVITRTQHAGFRLEAMRLGAVDYLVDPVSPAEIISVITNHLRPAEQEEVSA
jgi:DNA-binding response OmpR family regulator